MRNVAMLPQDRHVEPPRHAEYVVLPRAEHRQETSFSDYLSIFRRRKWLIIVTLLIVLAMSVLNVALEKPLYQATARLLIDNVTPKVVPVQEVLPPETSPNFYNTQYEMIRSREIVEKVVDILHLDATPPPAESTVVQLINTLQGFPKQALRGLINALRQHFSDTTAENDKTATIQDPAERSRLAVIKDLHGRLRVSPRPETKLVDVTLVGYNPAQVVEHVNTLAETYIQQNLDNKLEASKKAIAWLQEEATSLRQKTDQAELTLEQFKANKNFIPAEDFGQQNTTILQRLNHLNAAYVEVNTAGLQMQAQIEALKTLVKKSPEEIFEFPEVGNNPLLSPLQNRYLALKVDYANLITRYKEKHPRSIEVKAQIDEVDRSIRAEIQNMISRLEKERATLLAKESALQQESNSQKAEILSFSGDMRAYKALRRDLEIDQNLHLAVSKRLAETTLTAALATNNTRLVERAVEATPVSRAAKMIVLSGILGLSIGVGLALITEYFDKRLKTADEAERYLELPFLGVIPHYKKIGKGGKPITLQAPRSRTAEAYRSLRTWIQLSAKQPMHSLLITSATPAEGKTTTAVNLAVSYAQLGRKVLLIDIDMRHPALHQAFGLSNQVGLTDILVQRADWRQVIQDTDLDNVKVLSAGFHPPNPVELLSTHRMTGCIESVKQAFDLVIFDAPMVLSIPDVVILAPKMDGVLLVHYPAKGDRDDTLQAKNLLQRAGAVLIGMVFNNVQQKDLPYYAHHRYQRYDTTGSAWRIADDEHATPLIDMRPAESQESWVPEAPQASNGDARHILDKTAGNGSFALTLHAVHVQPEIAGEAAEAEWCFMVLEVVLANNADVPYAFDPQLTALYSHAHAGLRQDSGVYYGDAAHGRGGKAKARRGADIPLRCHHPPAGRGIWGGGGHRPAEPKARLSRLSSPC